MIRRSLTEDSKEITLYQALRDMSHRSLELISDIGAEIIRLKLEGTCKEEHNYFSLSGTKEEMQVVWNMWSITGPTNTLDVVYRIPRTFALLREGKRNQAAFRQGAVLALQWSGMCDSLGPDSTWIEIRQAIAAH